MSKSHHTENLKDVFVRGAGVSVPYGFPTGAVLLSRMRQKELEYSRDDYDLLRCLDASLFNPENRMRLAPPPMTDFVKSGGPPQRIFTWQPP